MLLSTSASTESLSSNENFASSILRDFIWVRAFSAPDKSTENVFPKKSHKLLRVTLGPKAFISSRPAISSISLMGCKDHLSAPEFASPNSMTDWPLIGRWPHMALVSGRNCLVQFFRDSLTQRSPSRWIFKNKWAFFWQDQDQRSVESVSNTLEKWYGQKGFPRAWDVESVLAP